MLKIASRGAIDRARFTVRFWDRNTPLSVSELDSDANWSVRRINKLASMLPQRDSYLEIGVFRGATFQDVHFPLKWGVDPFPRFSTRILPHGVKIAPQTSDEFFAKLDPRVRFDLIFLDGLHDARQCYSDFLNALKHSNPHTVFVIDDVLPDDDMSSMRDQNASMRARKSLGLSGHRWHGDVWKTLIAIAEGHPEMDFDIINSVARAATDVSDNPQAIVWKAGPESLKSESRLQGEKILDRLEDAVFSEEFSSYEQWLTPVDEDDFWILFGQVLEKRFPNNGAWEQRTGPTTTS